MTHKATFTCKFCGCQVLTRPDGSGARYAGDYCPATQRGEWIHEPLYCMRPFPALTPAREFLRVESGVSLGARVLHLLLQVTLAGHLVEVNQGECRIKMGRSGPWIVKRSPDEREACLYAHSAWLRATA